MRHQVSGVKLGRTTSHRDAMVRNMVTSLILSDRIETTLPKAKELRRVAEKMVTLAKDGSLVARRRALEMVRSRDAVQKLFTTLVDRYRDRVGGYTRIIKLGYRLGDSAPMAILEYLTAEVKGSHKKEEGAAKKGEKPAKRTRKAASTKAATGTAAAKKAPRAKKTAQEKTKASSEK